jgi:uncharacterized damage-inducible protein DinB
VTTRQHKVHTQFGRAAVRIFAANDRLNQILIEHLEPTAWRAKPPGKVRTIAAIFTHVHNVRSKWVRLTAPHLKIPRQLNRARCTPQQARAGLAESAARCSEMLAEAFGGGGRVEKFRRDGWGRPWPVGPEMLCYMLSHEAHHRGQVCMSPSRWGCRSSGRQRSEAGARIPRVAVRGDRAGHVPAAPARLATQKRVRVGKRHCSGLPNYRPARSLAAIKGY